MINKYSEGKNIWNSSVIRFYKRDFFIVVSKVDDLFLFDESNEAEEYYCIVDHLKLFR